MRIRIILLAAAVAGSVAFAPAAFSSGAVSAQAEGTGSDNFTLVENLPHSGGGRGSDIEFATLSYADAEEAAAAGFTENPGADALPGEDGIQKDIALAGTTGTKFYLYDITDPDAVYETAAYECPANQGDTQVFTRTDEDGAVRTFTTYTVEDTSAGAVNMQTACYQEAFEGIPGKNASGTFIIEITDPFNPVSVAHIPVVEGSHNGTVHPSGDYFYNSNSALYDGTALNGGTPGIEYYDISDFGDIQRLGKLLLPPVPASLGTESHDITFDDDGDRAYSAALSQGAIIDTSDPAAPTLLTTFVDPTIQVWHQSDPIDVGGRRFLVIEDEVAGAVGTAQCPNGGVHVYEVTPGSPMETAPVKVGYWNIDEPRAMPDAGRGINQYSCTAHVFRLYPEAHLMTISYYNGGVRVVDLGGLAGVNLGANAPDATATVNGYGQDPLVQVGWRRFEDSNSWAAKSPRITVDGNGDLQDFHVFSNGGRGLDVLAFDAGNAAGAAQAAESSQWLTPREAELALGTIQLSRGEIRSSLSTYSCLL